MKNLFFSCLVDIKNHASTAFYDCFIMEKEGIISIINILCVGYTAIFTNGRIQSLKTMRFDEELQRKVRKNEHKKNFNRRFRTRIQNRSQELSDKERVSGCGRLLRRLRGNKTD